MDAERLLRHGDDEFPVGAQSSPFGRLQVDADEQVVVAAAQRSGQVGVLQGVEELGFIHVAAQGVSHPVVAEGAHGAVEHEGVVVELHEILTLRQLQDVDTPVLLWDVQGHHDERFSALHHPAQPLAHFAHLRAQEVIGHTAPDDRGQHLHVQPGRTLGDGVVTLTTEHGCRDGHDVLMWERERGEEEERFRPSIRKKGKWETGFGKREKADE